MLSDGGSGEEATGGCGLGLLLRGGGEEASKGAWRANKAGWKGGLQGQKVFRTCCSDHPSH